MLSETLSDGLAEYRIGAKVRDLRTRKKLGLAQLAEHTGLSAALLSKIERGHIFPTLPTLLRIAMVFGVGLDHFFTEGEQPNVAVTRRRDRLQLPDRPGNPSPVFLFESLNFPLTNSGFDAYLAHFPPKRGATEPHRHEGTEIVYVLAGKLCVSIDGTAHELDAGDAITFDADTPHSYACVGRQNTDAVIVAIP